MIRMAIAILFLLPALALGQTKEKEDEDKVSNDNPARPLQMPPASTEVKDAIDDFARFQRRGAWERALKALYTVPEDQVLRFIDGDNGFIIPVGRERRGLLTALSPNGQAAYRLFYDSEAQKLFDEAEGPKELPNLERIFSAYFITSIGDNAADRLGDLYFELGRFDRAADCWLAVLRERTDSDLSPALLAVKAALALARAGRRSEFDQVKGELADRYSDEKITLGGQTGAPADLLRRVMGDDRSAADPGQPKPGVRSAAAGPDLGGTVDPAWQLRFADSVEAGMTPPELIQWESNPLSTAVPPVAVVGKTLFANYLGHIFAVDLPSGKMLWRSASFHQIEVPAMQEFARMLDVSRFAIVASEEYVWSLARDLKDQNYFAPFQLTCRRADNGEVVWKSTDLPDYAPYDLVGSPLLAEGKLFHSGQDSRQPATAPGPAATVRPGDTASRRQGALEVRGRHVSPGSTVLLLLQSRVIAPAAAGATGRCDLYRHARRRDGAARRRFGRSRLGVRLQDGSRSGPGIASYYYEPQEPTAAASQPLVTGEAFSRQGGAVRPPLCRRSQPDEGPLGPADHQVRALARRR